VSAGNIALTEAAKSYDPKKNSRFDLFAQSRVMGEMIDSGWRAKRSPTIQVLRAARKFAIDHADFASVDPDPIDTSDEQVGAELAAACDVLAAAFVAGLGLAASQASNDTEENVIEAEQAARDLAALESAKEKVSGRVRTVLERHILGDERLVDIAETLGVNEKTLRRDKAIAMAAVRDALLEARQRE